MSKLIRVGFFFSESEFVEEPVAANPEAFRLVRKGFFFDESEFVKVEEAQAPASAEVITKV